MRKIKFRGKRLSNGEWVYGSLLYHGETPMIMEYDGESVLSSRLYEVDSDTIGQFTGLYDKNGTEIYEGDFVRRFNSIDNEYQNFKVFWDGFSCAFFGAMQGLYYFQLRAALDLLVQGNIYDNPELLNN